MSSPTVTNQADRLRFPGLIPDEIRVWRAWLTLNEPRFDTYEYNVRVGQGMDPGPTFQQNVRVLAIANTKMRIDVLAWRGGQPTIIEVKRNPQPAVIGQLIGYAALWEQDNPTMPKPSLLLVCDSMYPDLQTALARAGIGFEIATPA